MLPLQFARLRRWVTTLSALAILALLTWKHTHGGVPVHHLLRRGDLPGLSCWWDGLVVPTLTWFLVGRARPRLTDTNPQGVAWGWGGGLLLGAVLAWSATHGGVVAGWAPEALLLMGLAYPIYRAECVLGFVLAMTPAFGAALPLVFAGVMAGAGIVMFRGLRALGRWMRRIAAPTRL